MTDFFKTTREVSVIFFINAAFGLLNVSMFHSSLVLVSPKFVLLGPVQKTLSAFVFVYMWISSVVIV